MSAFIYSIFQEYRKSVQKTVRAQFIVSDNNKHFKLIWIIVSF